MAQRYGGKYSPGAQGSDPNLPNPYDQAGPSRVGAKSNLLFALALPFAVKAFTGGPSNLFLNIGAAALMLGSAWLTREGLKAEDAYAARTVARRPAFPRKLAGSVLCGMALLVATTILTLNPLYLVLFGVLGALLHLAAFGADPMADKGLEGVDTFQTDRVARAVDEAEAYLAGMKDAILRAKDPTLEARVDRFAAVARNLFRQVEGDPGDLTAARKYLSVYLMGARDATSKFADVWARSRSAQARADYEALLTDLETSFAATTTSLLGNSHSDLDVEIKVLRDRLKMNA
jgi:hypothetical protein